MKIIKRGTVDYPGFVQGSPSFLWEKAVCGDGGDCVYGEVVEGSVLGMFDLRDVLQLVVDGFDYRPFAQQDFVFFKQSDI